jgi:hypothetical protein
MRVCGRDEDIASSIDHGLQIFSGRYEKALDRQSCPSSPGIEGGYMKIDGRYYIHARKARRATVSTSVPT